MELYDVFWEYLIIMFSVGSGRNKASDTAWHLWLSWAPVFVNGVPQEVTSERKAFVTVILRI